MTLSLPSAIAGYFDAERRNDPKGLADCFRPDGTVRDEGQMRQGRDAIEQWMTEAKHKYQHMTEPLSVAERQDKIVVAARLTGSFPGSPITLDHAFVLQDGKIVSLEIG